MPAISMRSMGVSFRVPDRRLTPTRPPLARRPSLPRLRGRVGWGLASAQLPTICHRRESRDPPCPGSGAACGALRQVLDAAVGGMDREEVLAALEDAMPKVLERLTQLRFWRFQPFDEH